MRNLDPDRRIVVGYVSSEFPEPFGGARLLAGAAPPRSRKVRDHLLFLLAGAGRRDRASAGRCVDRWVEPWQLSDDELADRIEADQVDILIDVSGHTAGNRLPVFARKPAPIQVTGFGHATGTGLPPWTTVLATRS